MLHVVGNNKIQARKQMQYIHQEEWKLYTVNSVHSARDLQSLQKYSFILDYAMYEYLCFKLELKREYIKTEGHYFVKYWMKKAILNKRELQRYGKEQWHESDLWLGMDAMVWLECLVLLYIAWYVLNLNILYWRLVGWWVGKTIHEASRCIV